MRPPLWWIGLTTFTSLFVCGCDYYLQPRGDWRGSWRITRVIVTTCRAIRAGR